MDSAWDFIPHPYAPFISKRRQTLAIDAPSAVRTAPPWRQALVDLDRLYDRKAVAAVKAPVQTVHADFPHTAYQGSVGTQHYAISIQKGRSG
jgi:hypothetical protein